MASRSIKKSTGENIFNIFNITIMISMCAITLYPFWHVICGSLSSPAKLMAHSGALIKPLDFTLLSYERMLSNPRVWTGYGNTIFYVVVGTLFNIFLTILAAYGLSRKGCMLNRGIALMIVFTMYFGGGLIPTYLLIKNLGMLETRWALIIPGALSTYNMIILRTAMAAIPDSLEESAMLDGASRFVTLFRIILPLVVPTLAVLILYYSVGHWNSWFPAAIYLSKTPSKQPLQLYLRQVLIENNVDEISGDSDQVGIAQTLKYAVIVIATLPILLLYPFLQKYFVKGVMVGSLKG
ncbi:MAG: carbohydrate ABC transporter permease [Christensenellales bacterium]|jgi:putative aldouronate transport system permease protein